jgi:hypothetical protein
VLVTKTRHFQGIGNAAAGFLCQALDIRIRIVVCHQHRVLGLEGVFDAGFKIGFFTVAQRLGLCAVCKVFLHQNSVYSSCHYNVSVVSGWKKYITLARNFMAVSHSCNRNPSVFVTVAYLQCMIIQAKKKSPEALFVREAVSFPFRWWVVKDSNLRPIG